MKKTRSFAAFFLVLTALCSLALPAGAYYSDALGEEVSAAETLVHQDSRLSTNVFWSSYYSNFRTENFVTYKPNGTVKPLVTYGDALTDVSTMSRAVKYLESVGYRVVCGINGDFFNTKNGLPVGIVVTDGRLRTTDAGYYAIGFRADGSAILGKPSLKVRADFGYKIYEESGYGTQVVRDIAAINKARVSTGGIYLFTRDFSSTHSTGNTEAGIDAVCTVTSGSLKIGGELKMRVDKVIETSKPTPIESNQIVLSVNLKSNEYWQKAFRNLPIGSEITLTVTAADERWNNVQQAMGALYLLAENGKIVTTTQTSRGPRTAVGQKPDGTLIFYTIDGRVSGHSIGATLYQTAQRLIELGCTTVLGLDGGGSTTISVSMPDSKTAKTINTPSDGAERAVTNKLFLVSTEKASGKLDRFYVRPEYSVVLAGSRVKIHATGVDTNYFPMEAPCTLTPSAGKMDGQTLVTPKSGGKVTVTASAQKKTGSAVVEAVATPDSVSVRDASGKAVESLKLTPGASVSLSASASYRHMKLQAEDGAFTWSNATRSGKMDGAKYTAVTPGEDTVTVACGGKSVSIPVTVTKVPLVQMDDFETPPSGTGDGAALANVVGGEYARYGRGAGELHYDLGGDTPTVAQDNSTRMTPEEIAQLSGADLVPEEGVPLPELAPADVYGENVQIIAPEEDAPDWESGMPDESGPDLGEVAGAVTESLPIQNPESNAALVAQEGLSWADANAQASGGGETAQASASAEGESASLSGLLVKPAEGGAQWRYARPLPMPGVPYDMVSIWVKGDGSGNRFSLLCLDASGKEIRVPVTALDFTEWRRAIVPLGGMSYSVAGYAVNTPSGTADDQVFGETPRTGVIYLDQMVATYNDTADILAPTVSMSRSGNVVKATVKDSLDGILPRSSISAKVNGVVSPASYDASSGVITITLPKTEGAQEPTRVTVTAHDASGNIGRASVDIAPSRAANKFNDIEGCWAADYINFLYNRKIAEPYADGSFRPYEVITRAEFAVMLARAVGLDGRAYADVQLPYADLAQIPASALPALKALYAENIMRGATGEDGRLYLMPNSGLTRAHASAMIGRSQKLGYGSAELPFPDANTIPAYAVPHIRAMVFRGILSGYADGYFRSGNNISCGQMAKILYLLA
ncbi:MAG: phosphodiester glycosidase family protein [Oscillibacter sp.]|nr:phosphodiester glycosidase family protein [Oscillibacter sp.]